jgi:hypothetical protein
MTKESTDNFFAAFDLLACEPAPEPVVFKLYYNDLGYPVTYTTENLPGQYIEITGAEYHLSNMNVRVKNNKIVEVAVINSKKLTPDVVGTSCSIDDICIVVPSTQLNRKWKLKNYYEEN